MMGTLMKRSERLEMVKKVVDDFERRKAEALAVARKHLVGVDNRQLTCPSVSELCQKVNDYRALADVAREQGDPVHFMAGLLAAGKQL